jgi:dienelactone hydrolase
MRAFFVLLPYALAHGHGGSKDENGGFTALAETLASCGVASIRMDFPGCGASVESFTENNITNMMADVAAARAYAVANAAIDGTAVGMFGYSMGGRVAILSASSGYKSLGLLAPLGNDGNKAQTVEAVASFFALTLR